MGSQASEASKMSVSFLSSKSVGQPAGLRPAALGGLRMHSSAEYLGQGGLILFCDCSIKYFLVIS